MCICEKIQEQQTYLCFIVSGCSISLLEQPETQLISQSQNGKLLFLDCQFSQHNLRGNHLTSVASEFMSIVVITCFSNHKQLNFIWQLIQYLSIYILYSRNLKYSMRCSFPYPSFPARHSNMPWPAYFVLASRFFLYSNIFVKTVHLMKDIYFY